MIKSIRSFSLLLACLLYTSALFAQSLKPGFDAAEYVQMLHLNATYIDTTKKLSNMPDHGPYRLVYRSAVLGLENRWDLWLKNDNKTMVISLRGSVGNLNSWLENFYAAMIPASGSLQISDSNTFSYKFSADPKALVHVGWTIGIGSLMPAINEKVKEYYARGVKQIIIIGHSQGAAMAYLLRSQLYYEAQDNIIPKDLEIKTYCSAAPKPGNQYYAYDYEFINRDGWAYTIINAADWVPEVPFAVQTVNDFNPLNPFTHARKLFRKQPFFIRMYLTHVYNELDKPTRRAQRHFEKYLGRRVSKFARKSLPQYHAPQYAHSDNYIRAGVPIILEPDAAYYKAFPNNTTNIFMHHNFNAYFYLMSKVYGK